jgi:uncharacterized protein
MSETTRLGLSGEVGNIEVAINAVAQPRGIAIVAHPHPLFGGTMDNKVVTTLMRAFNDCGVSVWRFNFRGVGKSEGVHDEGLGEVRDALRVVNAALASLEDAQNTATLPLFIAGFSFGGAVMLRVQLQLQLLQPSIKRPMHCALIAPAMWQRFGGETPPNVALGSLIVHGDKDDTVALEEVMTWARPQGLPVTVIPDGEHFFHGRLPVLKDITSNWCRGRLGQEI